MLIETSGVGPRHRQGYAETEVIKEGVGRRKICRNGYEQRMQNCAEQEHGTVFPGLSILCNIAHIPLPSSFGAVQDSQGLMWCRCGGCRASRMVCFSGRYQVWPPDGSRGPASMSSSSGSWGSNSGKKPGMGVGKGRAVVIVGGVCQDWKWKDEICGRRGISVVILEDGGAWWGLAVKFLVVLK